MERITKKKTATKKPASAEPKVKVAAVVASAGSAEKHGFKIIIRPLVTEKTAVLQSQNKYSFLVTSKAKKGQIKSAVKEMYGVDATGVNVVNVQGRRLRFGRNQGRRSDYKKAIVTLVPGQSITIHEGV